MSYSAASAVRTASSSACGPEGGTGCCAAILVGVNKAFGSGAGRRGGAARGYGLTPQDCPDAAPVTPSAPLPLFVPHGVVLSLRCVDVHRVDGTLGATTVRAP